MKRFRFPLQPVVVLRANGELRAREALGAAMLGLARAEEHLAITRSRVTRFATSLAAGRQERFSAAAEAQSLTAYRRECGIESDAERAMNVARTNMLQRRADYVDAHRRLETVHRLEAKARLAHQVAANRHEQAEFDDLAGRQASLRNRSSL
jgi:flagellar export protein FliJ